VLYNILTEFWVPMKLLRLNRMCLNEAYSKVLIGKNFFHNFHIQNGLKQGDALSPLLFNFAYILTSEHRILKKHVVDRVNWTELT
jgi:hypothetical protein